MSIAEIEKDADRIADAIVDLVERTDGPVTFSRLDREIASFAQKDGPAWQYFHEHAGVETVIWEGMTEAGYEALRQVLEGRRLAIQFVTRELYQEAEDNFPQGENWHPVILHPKVDANVEMGRFLMRMPAQLIAAAAAEGRQGFSLLKPTRLRSYTRDHYAT